LLKALLVAVGAAPLDAHRCSEDFGFQHFIPLAGTEADRNDVFELRQFHVTAFVRNRLWPGLRSTAIMLPRRCLSG